MEKKETDKINKNLAELKLLIEQSSAKALILSNHLAFLPDKEQGEKMDIVYDKISKCLDLMYEIGQVTPEATVQEGPSPREVARSNEGVIAKKKLAAQHRAGNHTRLVEKCPICNGA
jgi:hypothetical protein